ncbi:hypothetical protein HELRODRAFT_171639 [Helobdella robusta]|uniref:Uncharacterized protein n=1 Tax=Helobdella robusta TaxID=6412 RepID=T1F4H9_HELRO|nr:hypothetical protein HELRODRAFT_171639 [Helobdella robusta]ESO05280.1 hypothetical protein HELRODRAFT_171639 [Helobdella robusta]
MSETCEGSFMLGEDKKLKGASEHVALIRGIRAIHPAVTHLPPLDAPLVGNTDPLLTIIPDQIISSTPICNLDYCVNFGLAFTRLSTCKLERMLCGYKERLKENTIADEFVTTSPSNRPACLNFKLLLVNSSQSCENSSYYFLSD